jgi:hypothetical protein
MVSFFMGHYIVNCTHIDEKYYMHIGWISSPNDVVVNQLTCWTCSKPTSHQANINQVDNGGMVTSWNVKCC